MSNISYLNGLLPLNCWEIGLPFGSTIRMEMGQRLAAKTVRNIEFMEGSFSIWVYSGKWILTNDGRMIANSELIDEDMLTKVNNLVSGTACKSIIDTEKSISINFECAVMEVFYTEDDEDAIHLFINQKRCFVTRKSLRFFESIE